MSSSQSRPRFWLSEWHLTCGWAIREEDHLKVLYRPEADLSGESDSSPPSFTGHVLDAAETLMEKMTLDEYMALEIRDARCHRHPNDESSYYVASLASGTWQGEGQLVHTPEGLRDHTGNIVEFVPSVAHWQGGEFEEWKTKLFNEVFGEDNPHRDLITWTTFQDPAQMLELEQNLRSVFDHDEHDPRWFPNEESGEGSSKGE